MNKTKIYLIFISVLIILILALGIFFYNKLQRLAKVEPSSSPISTDIQRERSIEKTVILYFSSEDGEHLKKEIRNIRATEGELPKRIFEELKKGPREKGLYKILDDSVRLRNIYISGGVGFVDLDSAILNKGMGTTEELLVIYSIVNSICFSLHLSSIKFLVDGEEIDSFGHIDISNPIYPNYDIIR